MLRSHKGSTASQSHFLLMVLKLIFLTRVQEVLVFFVLDFVLLGESIWGETKGKALQFVYFNLEKYSAVYRI